MSDEWRMLGPEEVVQEGDESQPPGEDRFNPVHPKAWIVGRKAKNTPTFNFRRRVSTPATDKESLTVEHKPWCHSLTPERDYPCNCRFDQRANEAIQQMKQRAEKAEARIDGIRQLIVKWQGCCTTERILDEVDECISTWHKRACEAEKARDEARREIADLESTLRLANATTKRRGEERDEWHKVVTECESILNTPDTAISALMSNLPNLVRDLKTERDRLREQLAIAKRVHNGAVKEFDRLQAENDQLRAEKDRWEEQAKRLDHSWGKLRAENERLTKRLIQMAERGCEGIHEEATCQDAGLPENEFCYPCQAGQALAAKGETK